LTPRPTLRHTTKSPIGRCLVAVVLAVLRWYLRYGSSYRDVGELLAERGIDAITKWRELATSPTTLKAMAASLS
jgi:hypothetical protein